jgi:GT2 family glycosyltransferase
MKLSIVILNWNAAEDTIRCVGDITSWKRLQPTIWVVDNASIDDSAEAIARECPTVRLIRNQANLGFAGGNNQGIEASLATDNAPILLLNNDAFIGEEDVIRLMRTLQSNNHIGFVGPLLFDASNKNKLLSAGGKNPVKHHHSHIYEIPADESIYPVEYIPGTVILGRAEVFQTVGLLDEDYFFNIEVADLCMRAKQHGYISVIDTRAQASHALSRSSSFRDTLYPYYVIRNRFLFIRKHYAWNVFLYSFWIIYSLALWLKVQLNGQSKLGKAISLGLIDGLRGRFGGQNKRVLTRCIEKSDTSLKPGEAKQYL